MSMIEVFELIKRYGDQTAVDGVSFTVEQGEIFGILGPNGAVKTHLLHVYAKLGVKDRAAAVAVAFERGLLGPRR